jgi:GNAT superfamily N-acetyltransferase
VIAVRVATLDDADAVTAVLQASYPALMRPAYPTAMIEPALALMTRANPALLANGTFFVAGEEDGTVAGCGGWTPGRPGPDPKPSEASNGHVRQFAVRADRLRRGVGRALIAHTIDDARAAGMTRLSCYSSLVAVEFYASAGFTVIGPETVMLMPGVPIEAVAMELVL